MENHLNLQDKENPSPHATSPNSSSSGSSNSSSGAQAAAAPSQAPPLTPKSIPRTTTEANPYPTTFVQADTTSFKQVVQMLTGSAETAIKHAAAAASSPAPPPKSSVPPASKATAPKRPAFKLYERRSSMRNLKVISPLVPAFLSSSSSNPNSPLGFSPRKQPEILSPSVLDFPSLVLSPVTPLIPDPFNRPVPHLPGSALAVSTEDRAIAEKGFYLHPSPRTTPRDGEPPRLLPLFPVTSPRLSNASSAASPP